MNPYARHGRCLGPYLTGRAVTRLRKAVRDLTDEAGAMLGIKARPTNVFQGDVRPARNRSYHVRRNLSEDNEVSLREDDNIEDSKNDAG